ncbi:glycoside hydrolase family 88 protein [uncultured Alistipes sp.]|uniref:glycoside hydrolase family 88 protein n=1 Tax=uncultured Alistipes sp. TaxID=538949 RepID=UPI00266EA90C|nr:glycoside hydrolase family 88 protein [uncultured Alistipes sp.]
MKHFCTALAALLLAVSLPARAAVRMPAIFSDNMVLQQQTRAAVWGQADPKEKIEIRVSWNDRVYRTTADRNGRWRADIETPAATAGQQMTVSDKDGSIAIRNILIGEVWLCSGQSNMEFPTARDPKNKWKTGMADYDEQMKQADYDGLRLFHVEHQLAHDGERDDCEGRWVVCTPDNLKDFSAVGFVFGRELHKELGLPVGLIQATWGGTHAESWMPRSTMEKNKLYADVLEQFDPNNIKRNKDWCKVPATLWNGMIHPILPYTLKGCVWYQGESNSVRAEKYQEVFTQLIATWRKAFGAPDMPFYFVQIAPHYQQPAAIRDAQFRTWRSVRRTGMAVITDAGDSLDIHPRNKQIPGERLARWALNRDYGREVACESPYYLAHRTEGRTLAVKFANAEGLHAASGDRIEGFLLAGADRRFYPAEAKVEGDEVLLTAPEVTEPVAARYGWGKWFRVNLANGAGLPAVPFRTDAWGPDSYARRFADSEMRRFPQAWQLDHGKRLFFGYAQGVGCCAMLRMWKATGDRRYFDYVEQWADSLVDDEGNIHLYDLASYNIDFINSGKVLFDCLRETGKAKYRKAMDRLVAQMRRHPRTCDGAYWHKLIYPHQIWLDGLYMCSPFLAQYGAEFDKPKWIEEAVKQIKLCHLHTYDAETGLYHHAWDESRSQRWADPETGHSPNFWGRSIGWWMMALVDNLDHIPAEHPDRTYIISLIRGLADALPKYQDKAGLWYQVLDCPKRKGNFPEASVTAQLMYAYAKAANKGYLDGSYRQYAEKAFNGLCNKLLGENADGTLTLTRCCQVGGLGGTPYRDGSFEYYIGERMRDNDAKATGPFIMGCLELGK